jgi:hypothetical protein
LDQNGQYRNQTAKIAEPSHSVDPYGILAIGVFGSVAREEGREDSDVDVVVRILKPDLFMLVGIKTELEERLQRPVDIVTYRENMNQFLKNRIDGGVCVTGSTGRYPFPPIIMPISMRKQYIIAARGKFPSCGERFAG